MTVFFQGRAPQQSGEKKGSLNFVLKFVLPLLISGPLPLDKMPFSFCKMGFLQNDGTRLVKSLVEFLAQEFL